jgi:hypothetical protein
VAALDHVVLHVGPEAVLRPEDGRQRDVRMLGESGRDVAERGVDRCRIADDPNPAAAEPVGGKQSIGAKKDCHGNQGDPHPRAFLAKLLFADGSAWRAGAGAGGFSANCIPARRRPASLPPWKKL